MANMLTTDYTRGQGIETYDVNYRDITKEESYYPGTLATSTSTTFNDPKAVSAHYLATKVFDFIKINTTVIALIIRDKR